MPGPSNDDRPRVESAARDALAVIANYRRGEIDGLALCRALVNDESLREVAPIRLLLGFIGVESQFGADPDEDGADAADLAESRAEREELLAEESASLARDCDALAEHLERWQRDNPPPSAGD
ncbi:MAG: hypothetical protein NTY35_10455 [Planctomycetota bacterium]|nr:hypothetical protein [Planctomycetota bacterium]